MEQLMYARAQMGLSLAFHIIFAAAGVALPLLMVIADALYLRTRDTEYRTLAEKLAKGTAVLFAVGAVSGTVLSFELGLLWPDFMKRFGDVVGLPFALEGFAFFTEAIFLGIYLYGRDRVSAGMHLFAGVMVAVSGAASAFFVTLVNAFMNNPGELPQATRLAVLVGGGSLNLDPVAAMWSPSWRTQTLHVLIASYQATAFAMVGIHAALLLRARSRARGATETSSPPLAVSGAARPAVTVGVHRKALGIALSVAAVTALVQPLSGDRSAKHVAAAQPLKLAALEAQFSSENGAPLRIGGLPDLDGRRVRAALEIPRGLSFLAFGDTTARVRGLDEFPRDEWPPVTGVHLAFQVMVGAGTLLAGVAALAIALTAMRRRLPDQRWFLRLLVVTAPLGFVALEAGWLVTEWGRQPWIVKGLMRTAEAVTPFPHRAWPFWTFTLVYLFLAAAVIYLLGHQIAGTIPSGSDTAPQQRADSRHAAV